MGLGWRRPSPPLSFVNSLYHPDSLKAMAASCESCPIRRRAEKRPNSLIARIWRWHTGWCPGWKAYQKSLAEEPRAD